MSTPFTYTDTIPDGAIPIYVDASLLKKTYCDEAMRLTLAGYRTRRTNPHYAVGTAIHIYAAGVHTNILKGKFDGLQYFKLAESDDKVFDEICNARPTSLLPPPIKFENRTGVEFYFEVTWLTFAYRGVTYVIIICGTIDHLAFERGMVRIFDFKSSMKYKLEDIAKGYRNDVQFDFYPWALWKFGHRFLPLELHNAAREFKMTMQLVVVQWKLKPPRWTAMNPVGCTLNRFEQFELELKSLLEEKLPRALHPEPTNRNGWMNNSCPDCDFSDICHALPGMEDAVVENLYTRKAYIPRNHS